VDIKSDMQAMDITDALEVLHFHHHHHRQYRTETESKYGILTPVISFRRRKGARKNPTKSSSPRSSF
jgi:hypothetical protein